MNKNIIAAAVGTVLGSAGLGAQAALTNGALLVFDAGNYGNFTSAAAAGSSYFTFNLGAPPPNVLYTGLQPGTDGGILIGVAQPLPPGVQSHPGLPYDQSYPTAGYTSDHGPIDMGWGFLGNTGLHFTATGPTVVSDGGFTKTLDFSGWRMSWNGYPIGIPLGGGTQIVPSTTTNPDATYNNGSGLATITCSSSSCSNTSSFTLDYAAVVPHNDPSNFGDVAYTLHLQGHISSVPVPAAAWLLGSGLVGLLGAARRRRSHC